MSRNIEPDSTFTIHELMVAVCFLGTAIAVLWGYWFPVTEVEPPPYAIAFPQGYECRNHRLMANTMRDYIFVYDDLGRRIEC